MVDYTKDLILSWDDIHRASKALARKLHNVANWKGIACITRGGLIPAGIISRELEIRLIETICIHSYQHQDQGNAEMLKTPELGDDGKDWLIIDDLSDTGNTFKIVRDLYPNAHFAAMYAKPLGASLVDTHIQDVAQETWIHFPWDLSLQYATPIAGEAN